MSESAKTVAILAANPALSSILSMVLAASPNLRVRPFESQAALAAYMHIAPVDLIVGDFDCETAPADSLALALRADRQLANDQFQMIALTRHANQPVRQAASTAGIDEVIVKPMSPRYILERVIARLNGRTALSERPYSGPERRSRTAPAARRYTRRGDNVIQLFPDGHRPGM